MMMQGRITGTFIDEISYDIPPSNWSKSQWRKELDYMLEVNIDTLIFIRGGMGKKTIYPSEVFGTKTATDFAGFIMEEAELRNMNVYFGLYITDLNWCWGDAAGEIRKNKAFIDEIWKRYGHFRSFKGWYIPQEDSCDDLNLSDVMLGLSGMCKDKAPNTEVLISPFFRTAITCSCDMYPPEKHYEAWDRIFNKAGKDIDICAFQDGTAELEEMEQYYTLTAQLCKKYNIHHWVNAETFGRDIRHKFYPLDFNILKDRLELHKKYAEKIITFEFSHFMSPQSIYPSARNLNNLYQAYLRGEEI